MSELGNLFNKYGCDKTKKHRYEKIYEPVFKKLKDKTDLRILEIGVFHGHSTEAFANFTALSNTDNKEIYSKLMNYYAPETTKIFTELYERSNLL